MPYDENLAERFRTSLRKSSGVTEKRMMGGLCFLLDGNMLGAVGRDGKGRNRFMFRVGKENETEALTRPGAIGVEMGGRRMGGFVFVDAAECKGKRLAGWVALALSYVEQLPAK